jgi:hypothetical protein
MSGGKSGLSAIGGTNSMIRYLIRVSALAIICTNFTPRIASARINYDGQWSVLIVAQTGSCDRASRYGLQIVNGGVIGGGGVTLSGRVAPNGRVRVAVSFGSSWANGSGRLSRAAGRGSWSGRSGPNICSGYWTAERRN